MPHLRLVRPSTRDSSFTQASGSRIGSEKAERSVQPISSTRRGAGTMRISLVQGSLLIMLL